MYNVNQISGCGTGGNIGCNDFGVGYQDASPPPVGGLCAHTGIKNSKSLNGPSRIEQPLPGSKPACPSIRLQSGAAVFKLGSWRTPPFPSKHRASRAILIRRNHV